MPHEIERRILSRGLELRDAGDGKPPVLVGVAALYNSRSENLGGFFEELLPGCFDGRMGDDVVCRAEHDSSLLLGRTASGTCRIWLESDGLHYETSLPSTTAGNDVQVLAKRGDLRGSSFAFTVEEDSWKRAEDGTPLRQIVKVGELIDVSPVATPAYRATSVSVRALEQAKAHAPTAPDARSVALERFRSSRKGENRDLGYETKMEAIWCALYDLLGSPWGMDDGPGWCIEETFDDHVVVEGAPGQYQSYPVSFDPANVLTLGQPTPVVAQWIPVEAPADVQSSREVERVALELELGL